MFKIFSHYHIILPVQVPSCSNCQLLYQASSSISLTFFQAFNDILSIINRILEQSEVLIGLAEIQFGTSSDILLILDDVVEIVDKAFSSLPTVPFDLTSSIWHLIDKIPRSFSNIGFSIKSRKFKEDAFIVANVLRNEVLVEITTNLSRLFTVNTVSFIKLPKEVFKNEEEILFSYYFKEPSFFQSETELLKILGRATEVELYVQSNVLSATIGTKKIENLTTPIVMTFKKTRLQNLTGNNSCYFWDFSKGKNVLYTFFLVTA